MNVFTYIFLLAVVLSLGLRLWLSTRQINHVIGHRSAVPADFAAQIPLEAHQRAADYTLSRVRLSRLENGFETLILLGWTLGGGLQLANNLWNTTGWPSLLTGTATILSVIIIGALLDQPFSLWRTFVIEARYGFNRTGFTTYVMDIFKQGLIVLILGVPLLILILWLMDRMGNLWWLYVWAVWISFSLLIAWAFPRFIAPLFNRFEPLESGPLRDRVENLLNRTGFRSNGIYVMDGSKRSGHGNAYFTGLGKNKRIVFFDTLINTLSPKEVEAVLAHELGHYKHRHVQKSMWLMSGLSLAGLALLGWLIKQPWFYSGLGVSSPSTHMALLLFLVALPSFTFPLTPLLAWRSRKHEFEADAFAHQQTGGAAPLVQALVKLYRDNASTLTPDPLHSAYYDSHPPASIRVQHLHELDDTALRDKAEVKHPTKLKEFSHE